MAKPMIFTSPAQRVIVALDFTPDIRRDPITQAEAYLNSAIGALRGLNVTLKINTVARILGARAVKQIHNNGFNCFLDLKLFDITNTLQNDGCWITYYKPLMLTVAERIKPAALKELKQLLPSTLILPVGPLTDLDDEDFKHFGHSDRKTEVQAFFNRAWKVGFNGSISAPTDIALCPLGFKEHSLIVTPAVKPAWSLPDNNSANALTPEKAIRAGADAIVVGRGITSQTDQFEAAVKTIKEVVDTRAALSLG